MKRKFQAVLLFLTFFAVCLFGCRSTKKLGGAGDSEVVILIIDENNRPVKDYQLTVVQNGTDASGFSNEQGMCFFYGIPKGQLTVTGYKNEYTRVQSLIQNEGFVKVSCFRVFSAQRVFDRVFELYKSNHCKEALQLAENLCTQEETLCGNAIHLFRAYGLAAEGNKEVARQELNLVDKNTFPELIPLFTAVSSKLEEGTL